MLSVRRTDGGAKPWRYGIGCIGRSPQNARRVPLGQLAASARGVAASLPSRWSYALSRCLLRRSRRRRCPGSDPYDQDRPLEPLSRASSKGCARSAMSKATTSSSNTGSRTRATLSLLSWPLSAAKRVELLRETVPQLSRLAVLGTPGHPSYPSQIRAIEAGAKLLGVQVEGIGVRGPNDFEAAFRTARKAHALIQLDDVLFSTHRGALAELAGANRLPVLYGFREHEAGGLMSYGASSRSHRRSCCEPIG